MNNTIYLKSKEEPDFIKPQSMQELNRIGELVFLQLHQKFV